MIYIVSSCFVIIGFKNAKQLSSKSGVTKTRQLPIVLLGPRSAVCGGGEWLHAGLGPSRYETFVVPDPTP